MNSSELNLAKVRTMFPNHEVLVDERYPLTLEVFGFSGSALAVIPEACTISPSTFRATDTRNSMMVRHDATHTLMHVGIFPVEEGSMALIVMVEILKESEFEHPFPGGTSFIQDK